MSIHPTMTDKEVRYICESIKSLAENFEEWARDYTYNPQNNEYTYKGFEPTEKKLVKEWFKNGWI